MRSRRGFIFATAKTHRANFRTITTAGQFDVVFRRGASFPVFAARGKPSWLLNVILWIEVGQVLLFVPASPIRPEMTVLIYASASRWSLFLSCFPAAGVEMQSS